MFLSGTFASLNKQSAGVGGLAKVLKPVCGLVRKLIWRPPQLSNYCPSPFVEWPRRMWWEWPLGVRDYEETKTTRGRMSNGQRERERARGTRQEREWEREEREGSGSRLMWKCLRSPRGSPPPPRSVSLCICSTLSPVPTWIPLPALHSIVTSAFDRR